MQAFSPFLSNRGPGLDNSWFVSCSPSALGKFLHRFTRETLAISGVGVALHFGECRVAGDRCDHVRAASDLGEPPRGCLAPAMCGNLGTSGFIAKFAKPVAEARRGERLSEVRHP